MAAHDGLADNGVPHALEHLQSHVNVVSFSVSLQRLKQRFDRLNKKGAFKVRST
jgi:hypothetical protein